MANLTVEQLKDIARELNEAIANTAHDKSPSNIIIKQPKDGLRASLNKWIGDFQAFCSDVPDEAQKVYAALTDERKKMFIEAGYDYAGVIAASREEAPEAQNNGKASNTPKPPKTTRVKSDRKARIAFQSAMIEQSKYTKEQVLEAVQEKFPEMKMKTLRLQFSHGMSEKWWEWAKWPARIVADDNKIVSFSK